MSARLDTGAAAKPDAEPLLPLSFPEQMALIMDGTAVKAFVRRRAGQIITTGHTSESDLAKPPGYLARQAKGSLGAFLDTIGPYAMNMPRERRAECLKHVEAAGALLIALWERLQVEVPDA